MDLQRNALRWHAHGGPWLRSLHVSRREDRAEKFLPQESPAFRKEKLMSAVVDRAAELEALHADIARKNLFPFWAATAGGSHDEIRRLMGAAPRAVPFLWSYADLIEPLLVK